MKEKICPRCGAKFICNHDNIAGCQCSLVKMNAKELKYVAENYADCLCAKCLNEIKSIIQSTENNHLRQNKY